ncbi:SbmA/BacA-like family transporter [Klebsiella michiganensis]|uniref:ABC transporter ATP-binding protein/permease n=1 Tax=Klebsiella michiganensis TaxID=1134687 RepID=UPI002570A8FC|nr:SbmA/BacA-like family transporter [Klebsiella michiganensis]WJD74999.1 SbmA/BacA-like family transporter [Klebsiella michiganensis]
MQTLKRFYHLMSPFWCARSAALHWLLLLTIIGLTLSVVAISVLYNNWSKDFYDALADYFQHASIAALALRYTNYTMLFVLTIVCGNWLKKLLIIRCRREMTQRFEQMWLAGGTHYRLSMTSEPDNPDQRIAEDINLLITQSLEMLLSLVKNIARLLSFIAILWQLSGVHTLHLSDGYTITIHGYLVWAALGYAALSSVLAHLFGRHLHGLNVAQQHAEADYRATLLRIREHGEQIAFYRGEEAEHVRMQQRFLTITKNWRHLMGKEFRLETFTTLYFRFSLMIPVFAVLPLYLTRLVSLGAIMQARAAFGYVLDAFGWFIDSYRQLARWSATVERLWEFQSSLQHLPISPAIPCAGKALNIFGLTVRHADGTALFFPFTATLLPGEWAVLSAPSGSGKTTLLRALAGLCPAASGQWSLPAGGMLCLPQKTYLPQDTLRRVVSYPLTQTPDMPQLRHVLTQVGLPSLCRRLDEVCDWERVLSGGEQQRLALARALLLQPALLCLDEATSHLDDAAAIDLLGLLQEALPETIVLAISHQPAVFELFEHHWVLEPRH